MYRITEEKIEDLKEKEVFVFGSNERGDHAGGAARQAQKSFGFPSGKGFGYSFGGGNDRCFAIPTLNWTKEPLKLEEIQFYVNRFVVFVKKRPDLKFLVTAIGTGIAGFPVEEMALLFKEASTLFNVYLPKEFWKVLNSKKEENVPEKVE